MSPAQRSMCFAEWRPCWEAITRARAGSFPADEKAARMAITKKAIGKEKSWGAVWTQKEIDRLLGVIWAIAKSDNLELQIRQLDQPLTRAEGSHFAQTYFMWLRLAARDRGEQELVDRLATLEGRESYLGGICRRIFKCELCDIDDEQWCDVLSALHHTMLHKLGAEHGHPKWNKRPVEAGHNQARHAPAANPPARTGSIVEQGEGEADF